MPSAPASAERLTKSCQFSRVSTMSEAMTAWFGQRFFTSAISRKLVSGERSLISSMLLNPTMRVVPVVDRGIARGDVDDRIADRFPDHAAPAGLERAMRLVSGVGRRTGGDPKRIR